AIEGTEDQLSKVTAANWTGCRIVAATGIESDGKSGPAPSNPAAWTIVLEPLSRAQIDAPSPVAPRLTCGSVALSPSSDSSTMPVQAPPTGFVRPSIPVGLAPERAQPAAAFPFGSRAT